MLTVASSGVAALLLPGGRTALSRFKIPCDLDDDTVCDISRCTMLAELIEVASLVIWDEALMTDRKAFQALDRTLRDIEKTHDPSTGNIPFGGKVVVHLCWVVTLDKFFLLLKEGVRQKSLAPPL